MLRAEEIAVARHERARRKHGPLLQRLKVTEAVSSRRRGPLAAGGTTPPKSFAVVRIHGLAGATEERRVPLGARDRFSIIDFRSRLYIFARGTWRLVLGLGRMFLKL